MRFLKMSLMGLVLSAAFVFFLRAESIPAGKPSPELIAEGRELFNSNKGLGVKYACILCHKQDKAIKKSSLEKLGDKLPVIINKHITEKAKGPAIPADGEQMQALMAYIRYEHSK